MLDVREETRGQERSNAQKPVALMILGNWRSNLLSARGNDKKSGVPDKKQAFPDKKMPFRHSAGDATLFRSVESLPPLRRYTNDPPPPTHRHHDHRFRRTRRLLRHDRSEERVPSDGRFWNLHALVFEGRLPD